MLLFAQSERSVKTIELLQSYSGDAKDLLVSDPVRGGDFHYVTSSSAADNGVIFKAIGKSKGYWIRATGNEIFPEWWGTGATNSRSFIQSALNYGSANGKKVVLRSALYRTDSTLIIPSNTDLEIGTNTIIRMNNGSNKPMFQNKNAIYSGSSITNADSNITIHGRGIIAGGIQTLLTKDSILNATISLNNVKNIHISDVRIDTTSSYAIFISSFKNVYISKIAIENRNTPYGKNDDGIHFAGPGKTAYVDDCTIRCTDDAIAVLANELRFRYKANVGGDISDVHITNTIFNSTAFGFRFLASSANIFNCTVDHTTGTVLNRVFEFGNYGLTPTGGIMDNISINNTHVNVITTSHSKAVIYFNQGNYGTISLSNTIINGDLFSNSIIRVGNGKGLTAVRNIIITNYKKTNSNHLSTYDRYIPNIYPGFVLCWMISLFYLTWMFIHHTKTSKKPQPFKKILSEQLGLMERKLWYVIATPLMILSCVLFFVTLGTKMDIHETSIQVKLAGMLCLIIYHFICMRIMNNLRTSPFGTTKVKTQDTMPIKNK